MKPFTCIYCNYSSLVRSNFKLQPDRRPYCRDEHSCGERAVTYETQNEHRLAQRAHDDDSHPPVDRENKITRYWRGNDYPDDTTCDVVYIDRTTGQEVMRYDGTDPANTNPYYGASTDGECMRKRGLDLEETINRDQAVVTDAELRNRMRTYVDVGYDDRYYEPEPRQYGRLP